jgi:hypothetical protein
MAVKLKQVEITANQSAPMNNQEECNNMSTAMTQQLQAVNEE